MKQLFTSRLNLTTAGVGAGYLALIFGLLLLIMSCSSCNIASREGTTSPCWSTKNMVGYGPGGYGKGRMKN